MTRWLLPIVLPFSLYLDAPNKLLRYHYNVMPEMRIKQYIHVQVFTTQSFFSTIANFAILITRLNPYMGRYESDCFDN